MNSKNGRFQGLRSRTPSLAIAMALVLTLAGCNAIGGAFSSVRGAVFPSGDDSGGQNTQSSQASTPSRARNDNDAPRGSGSNEDRIAALEVEVAALRDELAQLKPSIERLIGIEGDIRILLTQLSRLTNDGTVPPAGPNASGDGQADAAPAEQNQGAAPATPTLRPVDQANAPAATGQPQSLRPIQTPQPAAQPAPATPPAPAAPTQLTAISPSVAPAEQVSVHLASFRQIEAARRGWRELQAAHSDLLGGLDYRISEVQLSGGRGTFYRVKAGPFTDVTSAEEVCRLMKSRNAYCVLGDFTGTQ